MSQHTVPNLWWVYNAEDNQFSTLPTGPFLVPALLFMGLVVLFKACTGRSRSLEYVAGSLTTNPIWQDRRNRYFELISRSYDGLSLSEVYEKQALRDYLNNPFGY